MGSWTVRLTVAIENGSRLFTAGCKTQKTVKTYTRTEPAHALASLSELMESEPLLDDGRNRSFVNVLFFAVV